MITRHTIYESENPLLDKILTCAGFSLACICGYSLAIAPGLFDGQRAGVGLIAGIAMVFLFG